MIMGILLALAAAVLYGSSDFGGGLASRHLGFRGVSILGSAVAAVLAGAVLILAGGPEPSLRAVAWGLASGLAGGAGTLVLYRGLARGQMSVVGPLSAGGAGPGRSRRRLGRASHPAVRRWCPGRTARYRPGRGQRFDARQARRQRPA